MPTKINKRSATSRPKSSEDSTTFWFNISNEMDMALKKFQSANGLLSPQEAARVIIGNTLAKEGYLKIR